MFNRLVITDLNSFLWVGATTGSLINGPALYLKLWYAPAASKAGVWFLVSVSVQSGISELHWPMNTKFSECGDFGGVVRLRTLLAFH